jgi:hypothetical protein
MGGAKDRVKLVHVEVETSEMWSKQKIEADVMRLAASMDLVPIARGADSVQRDLILVNRPWYEANRFKIHVVLQLCRWSGPAVSRCLGWLTIDRRRSPSGARVGFPAPTAVSSSALPQDAAEKSRPN